MWAHEHSYERLVPTYARKVVPSHDPEMPYSQPRATVHITTGNRTFPWPLVFRLICENVDTMTMYLTR